MIYHPPVLFSEVVNAGAIQDWFDSLLQTIRDLASNFPTPLAVLLGVIVLIIIVRVVVNLL